MAPDYSYLDPKIGLLEHFLHEAFSYRNFNNDGLVEELRHMKLCVSLWNRFYPGAIIYGITNLTVNYHNC